MFTESIISINRKNTDSIFSVWFIKYHSLNTTTNQLQNEKYHHILLTNSKLRIATTSI